VPCGPLHFRVTALGALWHFALPGHVIGCPVALCTSGSCHWVLCGTLHFRVMSLGALWHFALPGHGTCSLCSDFFLALRAGGLVVSSCHSCSP
jgi:hypothetical protein